MKKHIVSALNFYILKTNLSKIASKEVKIYVFENYFLKKRSCATVTNVMRGYFPKLFCNNIALQDLINDIRNFLCFYQMQSL